MPNWKKLIVSGSDANLNSLHVNNDISASSLEVGNVAIHGDIIPAANNLYDLGSPTNQFRDLYLSSASLYINGSKVLSTDTGDLTLSTDLNQSLRIVETGADTISIQTENGDITLTTTGNGNIELDASVQVAAGKKIISSDGNAITFGDSLNIEGHIDLFGNINGVDIEDLDDKVTAMLLASSADKDSFAEIVSLINSVDTENDTVFGTYVTTNNSRSTQIESNLTELSSSVNTRIDNISTDFQDITNKPTGLVSSSAQIASDISGSFVAASSSINLDISNLQAETINLDTRLNVFETSTLISSSAQIDGNLNVNNVTASFFIGDGSQLTGIQSSVVESATVYAAFTNVTSKAIPHNFGTKNVLVTVYEGDEQILPVSVNTTSDNVVTVTFEKPTTGRVVVAKGGHIVSGSVELYTYKETITGSSIYNIDHNLDEDFPIVQIYDTSKRQVIPAEITSSNSNQVQIEFNSVFNGTVVIKK